MQKFILNLLLVTSFGLEGYSNEIKDASYQAAYEVISSMLSGKVEMSFKRAVHITENAFVENSLSYTDYDNTIHKLSVLARGWMINNPLVKYYNKDSAQVHAMEAVFSILMDTTAIEITRGTIARHLPYKYDFDDFFGQKDWTKMFVVKLLSTGKGNCHSLPYLYKILSDELGVTNAWLSFAPNHIYIRNRCQGVGWYNTELTSGQFPVDAWIMASGYISTDAIRSGIYMDTLSHQQAVANCALDLAKGYERKYKIYTDSFIIKCCDLTLRYHPNNINAIIYKAETLKKMYLIYQKENPALAHSVYSDMEKLYVRAMDLGYKEMPDKMYKEWIRSMMTQKEKYSNKKLGSAIRRN